MDSVIYYFSGTGNSLHAAGRIADALGDCKVRPMAGLADSSGVKPAESRVGLVFPMYFEGVPELVERFCRNLEVDDECYLFALVTSGGGPAWALHDLNRILQGRLDAGIVVPMVGNYVALYGIPPQEKIDKRLSAAEKGLTEAASVFADRRGTFRGDTPVLGWLLERLMHRRWRRSLPMRDRRFTVNQSCTLCGTCVRVCPVGNILLEDDGPVWHHRCQECLACLHWCPERAIDYGTRSSSRGRYHHPDIALEDMVLQAEGSRNSDEGNGGS